MVLVGAASEREPQAIGPIVLKIEQIGPNVGPHPHLANFYSFTLGVTKLGHYLNDYRTAAPV